MNKQQQIETIQALCDAISKREQELSRLEQVIPGFFESDFMDACYGIENLAFRYCAKLTGIDLEALYWFIWDCGMGQEPKTAAAPNGYTKIIDSVEVFVEFENYLENVNE